MKVRESRASRDVEGRPPKVAGSQHPLLILISAPSGGGKTTLCQQLLAARPDMTRAVTCTTRAPRPGEKNDVDYYFLDPADFQRRVQAGEFIEHATVFGRSYGLLRSELLDKLRRGRDVLLNVDVQGAATIREPGAGRSGVETRAGDGVFDSAVHHRVGRTVEKTRCGRAGGNPKAAGHRAEGNRAVEKFRLPFDQHEHPGGFAADAGDCRGGENACGQGASPGILKGRAVYCMLHQAARQVITCSQHAT